MHIRERASSILPPSCIEPASSEPKQSNDALFIMKVQPWRGEHAQKTHYPSICVPWIRNVKCMTAWCDSHECIKTQTGTDTVQKTQTETKRDVRDLQYGKYYLSCILVSTCHDIEISYVWLSDATHVNTSRHRRHRHRETQGQRQKLRESCNSGNTIAGK